MIFPPKPDPGFVQAQGLRYDAFLAALHQRVYLDWYMEIGCRRGRSVAAVASKTIVVDPFFQIETNVIGDKPQFHAHQMESDAFFESGFLERNGIEISFCFIDGMHLIEYALRDFINVERRAAPGGAIAVHDCCPFTHAMTTRDLSEHRKGPWTGDVWKLIPILRRWRPDLKLDVLDCKKTGLLIVADLDPANRTLETAFDDIMSEYRERTLEDYGAAAFFDGFDFVSAAEIADGGFAFLASVALSPSERLDRSRVSP